MRTALLAGLVALAVAITGFAPETGQQSFTTLDGEAQPFRSEFNADVGKVRLVMYVSPTCGGCLRGADQSQKHILDQIDSDDLRVYVVWAPRNGGREEHVERVTSLVTDKRARQYWDEYNSVAGPLDEMLALTGPCAGTFMLYDRNVRWESGAPPEALYWEDAHARELNRDGAPQFDAKSFAVRVREMLEGGAIS